MSDLLIPIILMVLFVLAEAGGGNLPDGKKLTGWTLFLISTRDR